MTDEEEAAFERFCIITENGTVSDENALEIVIKQYGRLVALEMWKSLIKKTSKRRLLNA